MKKGNLILKIAAIVSFVAMIVVNGLANLLPLGGVTTGQASDSYANLFTPTGSTFAIWGIIYLLLGLYCAYQIGLFIKEKSEETEVLLEKVAKLFIVSSVANIAWIFSWHYNIIPLSVFFMIVILISLIVVNDIILKKKLSLSETAFIKAPFSVYLGWITVATIANLTVLLVSLGWDGFGITPEIWTVIILAVGAIILVFRAVKDKSIPYILVGVWAYSGILIKHTSAAGFDNQYQQIITTLIVSIVLFAITISYLAYDRYFSKKIAKS